MLLIIHLLTTNTAIKSLREGHQNGTLAMGQFNSCIFEANKRNDTFENLKDKLGKLDPTKFDSKSEPIHYKPKEKIQSEKG